MRVKEEVQDRLKCKVAPTNMSNVFSGVLCFFPKGRGLGVLEFGLHELSAFFFSFPFLFHTFFPLSSFVSFVLGVSGQQEKGVPYYDWRFQSGSGNG